MRNSAKYIIAFAVVVLALGYFVVTSMTGEKLYYKEIQSLLDNPEASRGRGLRISGDVLDGNFQVDKFHKTARFDMTDETGGVLAVVYNGTIPDAFEEGAQVVIEGMYDLDSQIFQASRLLAKCPSKYEAQGDEHPDNVQKHPADSTHPNEPA